MNKTAIEWTDYTWNPVTGCLGPNADGLRCSYCYANRLAHGRLRSLYLPNKSIIAGNPSDPFAPRFWEHRWDEPYKLATPSKIFVCSQADLLGDWIPESIQKAILLTVRSCPQHTFQFLTRWPQNLARFNPWPANCWVGATATNNEEAWQAGRHLRNVLANVRFLSLEPLLGPIDHDAINTVDWVIIGAQTGPKAVLPDKACIYRLLLTGVERDIPIFLKDNLRAVWPDAPCFEPIRQWPDGSDARSPA